jgi:hypothetical protein
MLRLLTCRLCSSRRRTRLNCLLLLLRLPLLPLLLLDRDATLMLLLVKLLGLLTKPSLLLLQLRLVGPAVCAVLLLMLPRKGFLHDWVQLPSKC